MNVLSTTTIRRFAEMRENNSNVQKVVVVDGGGKSVLVAFLLAFFLGPLGMLYATVSGGLIMMVVSIVVGIFTLGFGLVVTWPICVIWACIAASNQNKKTAAAYGVA